MKKQIDDTGWVDMDRLARIFTWLVSSLAIFTLGMVFQTAVVHDLSADSVALTPVTAPADLALPYTISLPVGWHAAYRSGESTLPKLSSQLAAVSDPILIASEAPLMTDRDGLTSTVVEIGKVRSASAAPYLTILTNANGLATELSIPGTTKAVQLTTIDERTGQTLTELVVSVGPDLYVLTVANGGASDTARASETAAIFASLSFK